MTQKNFIPQSDLRVDLPDAIEGLNLQDGLQRVLGRVPVFIKILRSFVNSQANTTADIEEAIQIQDKVTASRLIHTLKGLAGTIGADQLALAATKVEISILNNADVALVLTDLEAVEHKLSAVLRAITESLPDDIVEPFQGPLDIESVKAVSLRLSILLSECDGEAEDLFVVNKTLLLHAFPELFDTLKYAIETVDYKTAKEILELALNRKFGD